MRRIGTINRKDKKQLLDILEREGSDDAIRIKKKIEKELKPIAVSSRKAKGRGLQQLVAARVSDYIGIPWGKDEAIQSRGMGQSGNDVILIGEARRRFPFSVECKATEALSLKPTIDQAKANELDGTSWLVVHKRKGMDPIVIIDFEKFLEIWFK